MSNETQSKKKAFYADKTTKPKVISFDSANVPAELRAHTRWVAWEYRWKEDGKGGGKWTKLPLSAKTGKVADCTQARNHGPPHQAHNWVLANKADGVGFVLGDGYFGIDLDDHRDPDTAELTPFAQKVLGLFPSYAEVSPSGTGIKIFGRGKLPAGCPKQNKSLGVEVYDGGRYFTVTGNVIPGGPTEIQNLQPAIDQHLGELLGIGPEPKNALTSALGDQGHRETPRPSANGTTPTVDDVERRVRSHAEGQRLMDGDTTAHGNDESAADLALCNLIVFYTGDNPSLVDEVFRRSRLMRSKWCEKHAQDGRTYGDLTVGKAIAGKSQFYDWSKPSRISIEASENAGPDPPTLLQVIEPPWPQMAPAAYHGLAGEFVGLIKDQTEADPVALLVQFLVMFGSAAGRNAFARVERTLHYLNEFVVLVGQSAKGRKGTSEAWPTDLMKVADPEWESRCRVGKLASGEALTSAIRDPTFRCVEGVATCTDDGVPDKRLLITEGEFSVILKIAAKDSNTLSDLMRDAWDAKDLQNKSKINACKATNPHVSALAHTNESDLKMLLTENAMCNGFANRFLFFAVRRSQELPFGGNVDERAFEKLAERVKNRLEFARQAGQINWSMEAAKVWIREYTGLTRERYGLAGSLTSRAEAHTLRLAMLYAVLDGSNVIEVPHLEAGLAVWHHAELTAYRLFGGLTGDPLADDILRMLRKSPTGKRRWDIHQGCGKNIPSTRIEEALATLHGQNQVRSEKQKTGGRDAEVWVAVTQ